MTSDGPTSQLPAGLRLRRLTVHRDQRGGLAELPQRMGHAPGATAELCLNRGTFRAPTSARHDDYLTGCCRAREHRVRDPTRSPSEGRSALFSVCADADGSSA
jgi:hypothetical protein